MIEKNPILIEYQRRRNNGTIDPVTCSLCFDKYDTLVPMLLRYDPNDKSYYFQCWTEKHITRPGKDFLARLERELNGI